MKRPKTGEVIFVLVILGLALAMAVIEIDVFGTESQRRAERRQRAAQEEAREMFKGAENLHLIEEAPPMNEERAAQARLGIREVDEINAARARLGTVFVNEASDSSADGAAR